MKRLFTFFICFPLFISVNPAAAATKNFPANAIDADTVIGKIGATVPEIEEVNVFSMRLDSIEKEVPLDYNGYVQSYIETYAARKAGFASVLGKAQYYFPIYEKAFREAGIPEEIKYLSIVESQLNPLAVSRAGASGPWQFMYATARLYGLNMDSYVDERLDPIQASYAAAAYLRDAYQEFGDWLLAIASYNCGKGAVNRAIDRAGEANFWAIRPYLPSETRNYVPAFIATAYVMNYFNFHDITPQSCTLAMNTDTVLVNKHVALSDIAQALDLSNDAIVSLNPSYKRLIVNGTEAAPRRVVIPQTTHDKYVALYNTLYGPGTVVPERHLQLVADTRALAQVKATQHKIRPGETLSAIANRYHISVQDIKVWNGMNSNAAVIGRVLRLTPPNVVKQPVRKPAVFNKYITYKVQPGDTLSGIAAKFKGATVEDIQQMNKLNQKPLQPGMLLKIGGV